jgi:hypothetical protein
MDAQACWVFALPVGVPSRHPNREAAKTQDASEAPPSEAAGYARNHYPLG